MARGVYMYFLSKITELLDTVFFVLRKNDRQITFLHIYHHCGMMLISWGTAKYIPGGHGTFVGLINCFVHIIMYSYYLLAALGPKVQKYLWWKKYITTMQMVRTHQTRFDDCELVMGCFRHNFVWYSYTMHNYYFMTVASPNGPFCSPYPTPYSSTTYSTTFTKRLIITSKMLERTKWRLSREGDREYL